jgi:hypothetical protein
VTNPTEFKLQRIPTRVGPIALVTMDNGEDWQKPNTFGEAALRSLDEVLGQLETSDWRGLLLTGKPFVFAVGADRRVPQMTTWARSGRRPAGARGVRAIRDLPPRSPRQRPPRRRPEIALHWRLPHLARRSATSASQSSSGSSPPGRHPARPARRRGRPSADRREPAQAEQILRAEHRARSRRRLRRRRVPRRPIEWLVQAIEEGAAHRRPTSRMHPRFARRVTTPSTVAPALPRAGADRRHPAGLSRWVCRRRTRWPTFSPARRRRPGYAFDLIERRKKGIPDAKPRRIEGRRRERAWRPARDAVHPPARGSRRDHGRRPSRVEGRRRSGGSREAGTRGRIAEGKARFQLDERR